MTLSLDTIILFVQNVDRLKAFYVDLLNLEVVEESKSEWLLLKAGHCHIGLHKIGELYSSEGAFKFDNNTKLVFDVDEDLQAIRERLLQEKTQLQEIKTFDGYPFFLCDGEDPEGNVFQLRQRKLS
jgi:catechol-2,3-dioxygenase